MHCRLYTEFLTWALDSRRTDCYLLELIQTLFPTTTYNPILQIPNYCFRKHPKWSDKRGVQKKTLYSALSCAEVVSLIKARLSRLQAAFGGLPSIMWKWKDNPIVLHAAQLAQHLADVSGTRPHSRRSSSGWWTQNEGVPWSMFAMSYFRKADGMARYQCTAALASTVGFTPAKSWCY